MLAGVGGSVSGDGNFSHGSLPIIRATPDFGYLFYGWSGDGVTNPLVSSTTVLMEQARSVSATFFQKSYALSVFAGSGGSVRPGMETSAMVPLHPSEAVADEGHTFTGWTGSGVTDGNALSTTVLMDQNQSVTATFSRNAYTLRVYPGLGGNATGDGNFSHGSFASIEATPDEGYRFNGWSGMESANPLQLPHPSS